MVEAGEPVTTAYLDEGDVDRRDRRPRVPRPGFIGTVVRPDQRTHQELTMWRATDGQPTVLPKIAYGRGSRLYDVTGKEYIDGSGGPAVYCLGHAHPEVNDSDQAPTRRRRPRLSLQLRQRSDGRADRARRPPQRPRVHQDDLHHRGIGGRRIGAEDRPPLPLRRGCADPSALHRPRAFMARQHARRAVGVALQGAARAVRGRTRAGVAPVGRQSVPAACRGGCRRRRRARVPTSSNARSSASAPRTWPPSCSNRWSAPPAGRFPRHPVTRGWSVTSATATAC